MKCFHFTNGERKDDENDGNGIVLAGRASKVSWVRSFSVASDVRRSEFDSESVNDYSDSVAFHEFLTQRWANEMRAFTFAELKSATRGFSRAVLIGEGGFGSVYRGTVRAPDNPEMDGHKEWINEVNWLGVIKHPNLVKLVGYCAEDDERGMQRLLVYELMKNKSLEDHLLSRVQSPLSWLSRLKIAQDAARGLAYLHEEMDFQLIFRDFKASNILLDEDLNAKLSDFGLARLGPAEGLSHVSTSVVGTVGYAAPEYVQTGRLTIKSDVWSFGVVLYELITGRRAVDCNLPKSEQKLLEWVKPLASDSKKFHQIVDPRLEGEYCTRSAQKLASMANKCLMKQPKSRPKMSEVVEMLGDIINEVIMLPVEEVENEEDDEIVGETEPMKQGSKYLRKVLDIKERVSLRNKSIVKLDWKNWTPGVVRTR
ncbi:hypothetical protein V2J09_019045 [Rumex salicifolius]